MAKYTTGDLSYFPEEQRCACCRKVKETSEFAKKNNSRNQDDIEYRFSSICNECRIERVHETAEVIPDKCTHYVMQNRGGSLPQKVKCKLIKITENGKAKVILMESIRKTAKKSKRVRYYDPSRLKEIE